MSVLDKFKSLRDALLEAPFLWRFILSLLAGVGLSFIQAPYDLWFLIFPFFGLFYVLYTSATNKKQAFAFSYIFAIGYFVASLNWIGNALLVEGNEYRWVWPLAVIGLPVLLSFFTALYVTIAHYLFKKDNLSGFLGFCLLLVLSEWVRGHAFTGFPWNLYGYGWASVLPMIQSLSLFGPYGLTFLTIFWGCSVGYLFMPSSQKIAVAVLTVITVIVLNAYGIHRLEHSYNAGIEGVAVHIVQPNIAQEMKWQPRELANNFQKHIELSSSASKDQKNIYIWPETAMPPSFLNSLAVKERLSTFLDANSILLSGALIATPDDVTKTISYHNALVEFDGFNSSAKKLYAKSHLVPFGEYIPFQKYIPLRPVVAFSGFAKGNGPETIKINGYPSFSSLICYEIIFPHQSVSRNDDRPDYILTVTNDAWYGDSPGPYQHFQQARFRAIEQGVPVVRSANTGISGLIDPYGRVLNQTDLMSDAVITAQIPQKTPKTTFYSRYGDWPFIAFMYFCLIGAFIGTRKSFS